MTDKKLNLSKAERKPAFPVPTRAAPGLTGQPPLPAGKPMVLKKVSPGERAVLERYGWRDGDPVPENLTDYLAATGLDAQDASDLASMPPPVDLKTPALRIPKEINVEDLPEDDRAKYEAVLSALSDAKVQQLAQDELEASYINSGGEVDAGALNQAINTAAGRGMQLDISDDRESPTYANGAKKPEESTHTTKGHCQHCGWNAEIEDTLEVSETDKVNFLQTLLGLQPFTKTYRLFGDRMHLTVRSLRPDELDACFRQVFIDRQKGRTVNPAEEAENLARYKAAFQIVSLVGPGRNYTAMRNLQEWEGWLEHHTLVSDKDDTTARHAWDWFSNNIDTTESLHRVFLGIVVRFNQLVQKLEDNIDNPDFWPAIG